MDRKNLNGIFPIGTSRIHQPLELLKDNLSVNFPHIGYFHSADQILFLISLLMNKVEMSEYESRFFFRLDNTRSNQFERNIWQNKFSLDEHIEKVRLQFDSSQILLVEISTLKSFFINGIPVQGNPNYYYNVPYSDVWNKNYYEIYHPEITGVEVTNDVSSLIELGKKLSRLQKSLGKKVVLVGHLIDPSNPNKIRQQVNDQIENFCCQFDNLNYYDSQHLVERFRFNQTKEGRTDINHLSDEGVRYQAQEWMELFVKAMDGT